MLHAFGTKAPGVAWIGQFFVPIGQLFNSIEFGLFLFIILTQIATLILTYRIGRELCFDHKLVPLAGCVLIASAPLFVGLSHQYITEPLQLFAVTYFYWISVKAPRLCVWDVLSHLIMATSLAMLAKSSSPLYCILPALIAFFYMLKSIISAPRDAVNQLTAKMPLMIGSLIALAATSFWYVVNFKHVLRFIQIASSSEIALDYGTKDIFINKLIYWLAALQRNFFLLPILILLGLLVLIVVILYCIQLIDRKNMLKFSSSSIVVFAAIGQVVLVLIVLSLNINEENRYLLPLLPAIVILLISIISLTQNRILRTGFFVLTLLQLISVQAQATGFVKIDYSHTTSWLKPFQDEKQQISEITFLTQRTSNKESHFRMNIIGVEYPWLNANTLSFYSAKNCLKTRIRSYYTSLGYAEKNVEKAWLRLNELKIAYFISIAEDKQSKPPNFVNEASLPIIKKIRKDPMFVQEPFESKLGIIVFRNVKELSE